MSIATPAGHPPKRAWADGTRHLLVEPLEPLEKLAALPPRPRLNRVVDHGVLAPQSRWRRRAVAYEGPGGPRADAITDSATSQVPELRGDAPGQPRDGAWADLLRRGFALAVLACPRCGGRLRLLATLEDPQVSRQILAHLGLPTEVPVLSPPRPPPARAADLVADLPA